MTRDIVLPSRYRNAVCKSCGAALTLDCGPEGSIVAPVEVTTVDDHEEDCPLAPVRVVAVGVTLAECIERYHAANPEPPIVGVTPRGLAVAAIHRTHWGDIAPARRSATLFGICMAIRGLTQADDAYLCELVKAQYEEAS